MPAGRRFDLVVVGGGLFGLATALEGANRGRSVALVERDRIPNRAAASTSPSRKVKSTYRDPAYARLGLTAMAAWERFEQDVGDELFIRLGNLVVSTQPDDPRLEEQARNSEAAGGIVLRLDAAALRARYPQFRLALSANFEPTAGFVRATAGVRAMRRLVERAGITIAEGVPVERLERDASSPVARMADGRAFSGEQLVVAAGSWSRVLVPELRELITVKRAGVAYVSGLPAAFDAGTLPAFSVIEGNFYGFPRWRDDRVKLGWHDGAEPVADPDFDRSAATAGFRMAIETFLQDHFGVAPSSVAIEYASCPYDVSPASDFLVDAVPGTPGLFVVTGGSGHGFKFGSVIGRIALDRLDGVTDSPWWLPQFSWEHALRRVRAAEAATPI